MTYVNQQRNLIRVVDRLSPQSIASLPEKNLVFLIEEISNPFGLTMGEVGEVCEIVRQIITKEREPKELETALLQKLDEDNREKVGGIVMALSEKIFSKLLPALGIKVPIEMAIRIGTPKVEGIEVSTLVSRQVPLKRMPYTMPGTNPIPQPPLSPRPVTSFASTSPTFSSQKTSSEVKIPALPSQPKMAPPIIETSHERMSDTPIESLMKMLEGRVTEKDLVAHFEKLPGSLKNALSSVDSAKKVVDIGRKYALHVDKLGELGAETGMVILGFTHPGQFLPRLTRRLNLPEEKVRPIAQEINLEIFLKIREALKEVHGEVVPTKPSGAIPIKPSPFTQPAPVSSLVYDKNLTILPGAPTENKDENLDRKVLLKEIEDPALIPASPTIASDINLKKELPPQIPLASEITTTATVPAMPLPPAQSTSSEIIPLENKPPEVPLEKSNPIPAVSQEATVPESVNSSPVTPPPVSTIPTIPNEQPQSIADRKLQGTTSSTKSESNYRMDPYRESLQ